MKTEYVLEADWRVAVYDYRPQRACWSMTALVRVGDPQVPEEVRTALLASYRLGNHIPLRHHRNAGIAGFFFLP